MNNLTAEDVLRRLADNSDPVLHLLAECRKQDSMHVWESGPQLGRRFARLLLDQGHPTLALEVAARNLAEGYPDDPELQYYRALALANCGNASRAEAFVKKLLSRADLPPAVRSEALSLAGRIAKDHGARASDPAARRQHFSRALWCYQRAYEHAGHTFPGINAATLARLCGDRDLSRRLAARVRDKVLADLDDPARANDYWLLATLGEAYLLLGDEAPAAGRYAQAVRLARENSRYGAIASMLRQLLLIRETVPGELPIGDELLGLFRLGPVVVFAGHGLDRPGEPQRFPADAGLEAAVRRAIRHELDALEPTIGYCSPGNGSEILFGELMHDRGAELHVVLPFAEKDFVVERLTYGVPELEGWRERYEKLRGVFNVTRHSATTEEYLGDRVLYDFNGVFLQGLALTRAEQVGVEVVALVVREPNESITAGIDVFAANWVRRTGRKPRSIDLAALRAGVPLKPISLSDPPRRERLELPPRTVRAMLFADVAGFSGLPEPHLPPFFIEFLRLVELELSSTTVLSKNTWGDGLYLVFEDVTTCADFALRLLDRFESFTLPPLPSLDGLKEDKKPGVRIGLHTGPVFKGFDAIIGRDNYFGSHVSRAARIEPVTAPGCAFVSEQFAAALAVAPGHGFTCEYLGRQPLAKDYDVCPLYRLTRKDAPRTANAASFGVGAVPPRPPDPESVPRVRGGPVRGGPVGAGGDGPAPLTDEVTFSVTAPTAVTPGSSFVLQVWAYLRAHAQEVLRQARAAQGGREVVVSSKGPVLVQRGAALEVRVKLPDFEVEDDQDVLLWAGEISSATFPVRAPATLAAGGHNGLAEVFCNGLRIAKVYFTITVGPAPAPVAVVTGRQDVHRSAFASYASLDRRDVLARIQGMLKVMPQMHVFLDVHDLRSGEDWRARIEEEIGRRDVLYLFWSANARASEHVEWEWRTAYRIRGLDGIDPVPLAPPDEVAPPAELAERHFNDWTLAFTRGLRSERA